MNDEKPLIKKLQLKRETIRTGIRAGYHYNSANDGGTMGHGPNSGIVTNVEQPPVAGANPSPSPSPLASKLPPSFVAATPGD